MFSSRAALPQALTKNAGGRCSSQSANLLW